MSVEIYTDGSSRGNPGRGGFGTILKFGPYEKELSGGYKLTTNNRMELLAVVKGLEAIIKHGIKVTIFSDSKYVVESVEKKWLDGWLRTNFKGKKNADLWKRYALIAKNFHVKFVWIKGHNDHPYNERCDQLATAAADSTNLEDDSGYIAQQSENGLF